MLRPSLEIHFKTISDFNVRDLDKNEYVGEIVRNRYAPEFLDTQHFVNVAEIFVALACHRFVGHVFINFHGRVCLLCGNSFDGHNHKNDEEQKAIVLALICLFKQLRGDS